MQRGLFKLRLEDGDDVVVFESCNVKTIHNIGRRQMDSANNSINSIDHSNSSDDDNMNEPLGNIKSSAKQQRLNASKMEQDERKPKLARLGQSLFIWK